MFSRFILEYLLSFPVSLSLCLQCLFYVSLAFSIYFLRVIFNTSISLFHSLFLSLFWNSLLYWSPSLYRSPSQLISFSTDLSLSLSLSISLSIDLSQPFSIINIVRSVMPSLTPLPSTDVTTTAVMQLRCYCAAPSVAFIIAQRRDIKSRTTTNRWAKSVGKFALGGLWCSWWGCWGVKTVQCILIVSLCVRQRVREWKWKRER